MLKLVRLLIVVFILFINLSAPVECQEKDTGIGIILGEPTGFTGKMWLDRKMAYDGGIAWSFAEDPHFHIHGDVLWHNWNVFHNVFELDDSSGSLPLYYGIGGILKVGDNTKMGMRFVLGTAYILKNAPFDIFLEVAPIMNVVPRTEFGLNAAIGSRFWF